MLLSPTGALVPIRKLFAICNERSVIRIKFSYQYVELVHFSVIYSTSSRYMPIFDICTVPTGKALPYVPSPPTGTSTVQYSYGIEYRRIDPSFVGLTRTVPLPYQWPADPSCLLSIFRRKDWAVPYVRRRKNRAVKCNIGPLDVSTGKQDPFLALICILSPCSNVSTGKEGPGKALFWLQFVSSPPAPT